MGWGAPARLALCVVRSRARGAGAGPARRHRDRESPATAREGLPVQSGGGSGLGLLELARTYYYAQRPGEGWHTYFAGARLARSAAALALYRADLSALVGPDEMAPFDGFTSPGQRAAWLERFWLRRDAT